MKRRMKDVISKKILPAVLTAGMIMGLGGCGNTQETQTPSNDNANAGTVPADNVSSETDAQVQGGDIYWFSAVAGWGPGNWNGVDTNPLMDAMNDKFGITFTIEQPPTDANTKLGLMGLSIME